MPPFDKHQSRHISRMSVEKSSANFCLLQIGFARDGYTLVVTILSRFARSILDLWKNVEKLDVKGVSFQILDMNLDTSTPTGKLLLTMLGAVFQFEREILLERQLVGVEKAKQQGKFKGRVPTAKRKSGDIQRLLRDGMKPIDVAEKLGVGVASIYRYRTRT